VGRVVLPWQCYLRTSTSTWGEQILSPNSASHKYALAYHRGIRESTHTHSPDTPIRAWGTEHTAITRNIASRTYIFWQNSGTHTHTHLTHIVKAYAPRRWGLAYFLKCGIKIGEQPSSCLAPQAVPEPPKEDLWLYSMTARRDKKVFAVAWSHFLLNRSTRRREWGRTCGGGSEMIFHIFLFPQTLAAV